MILLLGTEAPQLSDASTISSILSCSNTSQLANIVDKSSTNQITEKIEAQLTAATYCNEKLYKMWNL